MELKKEYELVIVGAGVHGLSMAITYLQVNPHHNVLIVEKAMSIGGTWAKERVYSGLKTNNAFGSYEFSDLPMPAAEYGEAEGSHIPGLAVHEYLSKVSVAHKIDKCICYGTSVESATQRDDGKWSIQLLDGTTGNSPKITAHRLVIATGITSEPNIPSIPGADSFKGLAIHAKQMAKERKRLDACKDVVVIGGNKSSWDICYLTATAGAQAHMVIRPSGGGPSYLWPSVCRLGPLEFSFGPLSGTRIFTLFDPTPYHGEGLVQRFLHRTTIGISICLLFWNVLDKLVRYLNGYSNHPETKKLEPWTTPFWVGNSVSINNYDEDYFRLVREGKIKVHIADAVSMSEDQIRLSDGSSLKADALVYCTGWKPKPSIKIDVLGTTPILSKPKTYDAAEAARLEEEVYRSVPYLRTIARRTANAPKLPESRTVPSNESLELYRHVVPSEPHFIKQKNLAFIGAHSSPHAIAVAQAQALWITAFFGGRINHLKGNELDLNRIKHNTALHRTYGEIRRPTITGGFGDRYPDIVFDSLPYIDTLLEDVGVKSKRKSSWWKDLTEPYGPAEYDGITEEWLKQFPTITEKA